MIDELAFEKLCSKNKRECGLTEHGIWVWRQIIEAYEAAKPPAKRMDEARAVEVMGPAIAGSLFTLLDKKEQKKAGTLAYRALLSVAEVVER